MGIGALGKFLSRTRPRTGRVITESGYFVNMADVATRFIGSQGPFGGVRTTPFEPIFSVQPIELSIINDRVFETGTASVTFELDSSEYRLFNPGGETCRLETGQRGRYQSGIVGVPGLGIRRPDSAAPGPNTVYRFGYFDGADGFGFKETEGGISTFVRRNSVEEHTRARENWLDPLDGTGPSGRTISIADGRIVRMPFAWYGYGTIEIGIVVDDPTGRQPDEFIVVDRYKPIGQTSVRRPNLPITAEIEGPGEIYVGGRQYGVWGTLNLARRLTGEFREGQSVGSGDMVPLISAQARAAEPWDSVPVQFAGLDLITSDDLEIIVLIGGTLNTSDWAISQYSNGDTATEYNTTATAISGATIFGGPWLQKSDGGGGPGPPSGPEGRSLSIPAQDIPIGVPVTLAARGIDSTATVTSAMRIAELR